MQLNQSYKIQDNSYLLFLIFMGMQIKKVAFYLEILSQIPACKLKVYYLQNTCLRFVTMWSLNHAISVKSKCRLKTKMKTCQKKAVLELLFIDGRIPHIVIPSKQVYLKMSS
jgi:hypothetical protein